MCAWVQEHPISMTKMIRLKLWGPLVGLLVNVTATWHRSTSEPKALGEDREPRKASPAPRHVFHWVRCWQSRDSWRARRRHGSALGTEGYGERVPQRWHGDLESLNSNSILSIQSLQIQTEGSPGTAALRHLAETDENLRWRRNIHGSIVFLEMTSHP